MRIETPSVAPQRGGLLNVVDPITLPGHAGFDGVTFEDTRHGIPSLIPEAPTGKTLVTPIDTVTGAPFWIYSGYELSLFDSDDPGQVAQDVFGGGETVAVEQGLLTLLNAQAVDLTPTPGTEVGVLTAIGILEQYAATNYGGLPLMHVSKYGAAFVGEKAEIDDSKWVMHTRQGTPVVNGGGYSTGGPDVTPNSADFWLYISGQVHLYRTEPVVTEANVPLTNRKQGIVERAYIPVVDHFVAAILVSPAL